MASPPVRLGVEMLPEGNHGRRRLRETEAYYRFAARASVTMMEQWRAQKDELLAQLDGQRS